MRFLGIDPTVDRPRIQALRASPPEPTYRGARRRVFGAALGQWDVLLGASEGVPASASPILLFYALAQAGRAVCAARISGQHWRSSGHGLRIGQARNPIGDTVVNPDGGENTSFNAFCRAVGASPLAEGTRLGALWAAVPQLQSVAGLADGDPPAIGISLTNDPQGPPTTATIEGELAKELPDNLQDASAELARRLGDYPGAADGLVVCQHGRHARDGQWRAEIQWHRGGELIPVTDVAPYLAGPDTPAYLRPGLKPGRRCIAGPASVVGNPAGAFELRSLPPGAVGRDA